MRNTNKKANENQVAASSYILAFYSELNELMSSAANYINIIIRLSGKMQYIKDQKLDIQNMGDDEKVLLEQQLQNFRFWAIRVHVKYLTLNKQIGKKEDKEITEIYKHFQENYIIERDKVEKYVIHMNDFIANEIMQDLLLNSQDLIEQIYTKND